MDNLINCLDDISNLNVIYTIILLATASNNLISHPLEVLFEIIMIYNTSSYDHMALGGAYSPSIANGETILKPNLLIRIFRRIALISDNIIVYLQNQFNEHTATSVASLSVLIIVISIICCIIISLVRKEERKIKEQYKKLNAGSSQSFIAIGGQTQILKNNHQHPILSGSININYKLHVIELRRETYFGLVRLLKPGCRTIVLLCDAQCSSKLLTKFYQCIYPYRKNKTLQFAFLLIGKNISWYKDLLKLALNEKRDLHINPINCIGTVLVINGFKKYFSVYHASDSRCDPDEPLILLEESLLDNFPDWLERLFAGKASRYYVKYWPDQMR